MPSPNEMPPVPKPEAPKPGGSPAESSIGGSGRTIREIERAREIIREATSPDARRRDAVSDEIRSKPKSTDTVESAKARLNQEPGKKAEWFMAGPEEIVYSEKVANLAHELTVNAELARSPEWLTAKAYELALSPSNDMTREARLEVSQAIGKLRSRVSELTQQIPESEVTMDTFDTMVYGGEVRPVAPDAIQKAIFDEEHPEEEEIIDPALVRKLREVNRKMRVDPEYANDLHLIENDIRTLSEMISTRLLPEDQASLALDRLRKFHHDAQLRSQEAYAAKMKQTRGTTEKRAVRYEDVVDSIPEDQRISKEARLAKGEYTFGNMPSEDVDIILRGSSGEREYFDKLIDEIYQMGRSPNRATLPQEYRWLEFKEFIEWKYSGGDAGKFYTTTFEYIWNEMPRHSSTIKNLMFTPGDPREKLKNIQFLGPGDFDHYVRNYEFSNYATSLYDEVVRDRMSERRIAYKNALTELSANDSRELKRFRDLRKARGSKGISDAEMLELRNLEAKVDVVGNGVMLWDEDILSPIEAQIQINGMVQQLDEIKLKKMHGQNLEDWEKDVLARYPGEIEYKQGLISQAFTRDPNGGIKKHQHDNSGMSQIDVEVKERLRKYLSSQGREPAEWQLNRAVWAARMAMVGSGRVVAISSGMAVKPAYDFILGIVPEANIGKYVMKSPAFEDLQRIVNPDLFQDRFGMGDQMGQVYRAFLRTSLLERKGYDFRNDPKFRLDAENHLDPVIRKSREFLRQVQDQTGIDYTEMLLQGFFDSGGIFDRTGWRLDIAVTEARRKKLLSMENFPEGARLDNQGIGIQLLDTPQGEGRTELLHKLIKRNPSVALQLLGEPLDKLYTKYGFTDQGDRDGLRRALSQAQIYLWDRPKDSRLEFGEVNLLSNRADFDQVLRPFLEREGFSANRIDQTHNLLASVEHELGHGKGSKLEALSKHDMPMTLSLSDFDWADANFHEMGTIAVDRRGRDMYAMARARDAWIMMHKPEFLINRKPEETLKKLKEFREAMNEYTMGATAEKATYELAKAWMHFNENRSRHSRIYFGADWIPLHNQLRRAATEVDMHNSPLNLKWLEHGIGRVVGTPLKAVMGEHGFEQMLEKNEHWFEKKVEPIGKKFSEGLSYGVRYGGPGGNAWEEKEIDHVLDQMLELGIFNADEDLYHKLRREFKAGIGDQFMGILRKYWWIFPIIVAVMGLRQGMKDEESKGGGGH